MLMGRKYDIKVVINSTGITLSTGYQITTNIYFNFTRQHFDHLYKYWYGFSFVKVKRIDQCSIDVKLYTKVNNDYYLLI